MCSSFAALASRGRAPTALVHTHRSCVHGVEHTAFDQGMNLLLFRDFPVFGILSFPNQVALGN